jgi:hypothetical protein
MPRIAGASSSTNSSGATTRASSPAYLIRGYAILSGVHDRGRSNPAVRAAMHPWFIYNSLRMALVALSRRNLGACERFVRDAKSDLTRAH